MERLLRPEGGERSDGGLRKLFERAGGGGVLPLLFGYCREKGIDAIPESARRVWRSHLTRQTVYRHQIPRILELLEGKDIAVTLLKGAPLAVLLYGNEKLRYSSDIDLLVSPEDVEISRDSLEEVGYEALEDRPEPWGTNQLRMQHRRHGSKVELHWGVTRPHVPAPAAAEWLRHTERIPLARGEAPAPEPAWALMHLCYHFHNDHGGLKAILDLAAWHDRYESGVEPRRVLHPMDRARGLGVLHWPLLVLEELSGHRSALLEASRPPRTAVRELARRTCRQIEQIWLKLEEPSWGQTLELADGAAGTLIELCRQSASLVALDDWTRHPERFLYPFVFGHHRYGRQLFDWLEEAGWVDRDQLYNRSVF